MKKSSKLIIAGTLSLGVLSGAALFTPTGSNAASNVVLASVDWVTSQINPLKSKVSSLESKVNTQQKEIDALQSQIAKLSNSNNTDTTDDSKKNETNSGLPSVVYVDKSSARIHSGATRQYKIVAQKSKGTSLKVIDSVKVSTGTWYRVSVTSSLKGWIYAGDVSTSKTTAPSSVVITKDVHVRKGATTGYPVVKTLKKGEKVKYISSFRNNKGETWYNVQISSGVKGWMVSTHGEVK